MTTNINAKALLDTEEQTSKVQVVRGSTSPQSTHISHELVTVLGSYLDVTEYRGALGDPHRRFDSINVHPHRDGKAEASVLTQSTIVIKVGEVTLFISPEQAQNILGDLFNQLH